MSVNYLMIKLLIIIRRNKGVKEMNKCKKKHRLKRSKRLTTVGEHAYVVTGFFPSAGLGIRGSIFVRIV